MCLTLSDKTIQPIIAEKDIICYKWLIKRIDPSTIEDGSEFTATIKGIKTSGKVSIDHSPYDRNDNKRIFFCTNEKNLDGLDAKDKKGYKYSWAEDADVKNVVINGKSIFTEIFETPFQNTEIKIGEEYTSELIKENNEINVGIHSFTNLDNIKNYIEINEAKRTIAKCIIPKGSLYYEGKFNDHKSYASDKIKYIELVQ